jgi:hypothetical protein
MKNDISLSIKTPCSEHFESFSPTPSGGFCGSCQKEVIDFTVMNSEDIIQYFKTKSSKNTCGRFYSKQLQPEKKRNILSFFSGIGLACLALFSFSSLQAQNTKKQSAVLDHDASKIEDTAYKSTITVKGTVMESSLPLPGASIVLEGTSVGVQSDFDGYFEFPQKLKKGDVLVFSYVGLQSQRITIQDEKSAALVELNIDMTSDSVILMGKVATKKVFKSKRN